MTIIGFRRWLKTQIASLDDDTECAIGRADETVEIIREAEKIAIELGLPDIARHCTKVTTTMLALRPARLFLCECLAMVPSAPTEKSNLLTVRQAAEHLNLSGKKVYELCQSGQLRCFRAGRTIRIPPEEIERFKAESQPIPASPRLVGRDHLA